MSGLDSLHTLLEEELKDIYDAGKQLTKALPKMTTNASAAELKERIRKLSAADPRARRADRAIEQVFERIEMPARGKKCVSALRKGRAPVPTGPVEVSIWRNTAKRHRRRSNGRCASASGARCARGAQARR